MQGVDPGARVISTCGHLFWNAVRSHSIWLVADKKKQCKDEGGHILLSQATMEQLISQAGHVDTIQAEEMKSSPKFDLTFKILEEVPSEDKGGVMVREKTLIFSQWTAPLDMLEPHLKSRGYKFARIDGTMNLAKRSKALQNLKTDTEVRCNYRVM